MGVHPILKLISDVQRRHQHKPLIGAEVERIGCDADGHILQYSSHIEGLLKSLVDHGNWSPSVEEDGRIMGLQKELHAISLEPGAQLEIAPAPSENIFDLEASEAKINEEVLSQPVSKNWAWIWTGLNPWSHASEIELIPSKRYSIMTEYFPHQGRRGLEMMRLTAGSHLNLDFYSAEEAIEILQAACLLVPLMTAIFANSPFYLGKRARALSERTLIWEDTDPLRSGLPKAFLDPDFCLKDYVNLVESIPLMYFQDEQGFYKAAKGAALKDLSKTLMEKNALSSMRQLFTDVRIKPCCIEFRSLDQQEPRRRSSAFSMLVGVLYDSENRKWAREKALELGVDKIRELHHLAAMSGMQNDQIYKEVKNLITRAEKGLVRRAYGEEKLLQEAEFLIQQRKTPAELSGGEFLK